MCLVHVQNWRTPAERVTWWHSRCRLQRQRRCLCSEFADTRSAVHLVALECRMQRQRRWGRGTRPTCWQKRGYGPRLVLQTSAVYTRGGVRMQDAKAAALGPRHQTNMLAEALAEPLLGTVRQQADIAAANGWFWTYQLDGIKVPLICIDGRSLMTWALR